MKELYENINYLLDTTKLSCQMIADVLSCDLGYVEAVVHERFMKRIGLT